LQKAPAGCFLRFWPRKIVDNDSLRAGVGATVGSLEKQLVVNWMPGFREENGPDQESLIHV
ncbi:MAG: hypothetical protein ACPG43_10585, partial [Alcanivoracaceae bacterium]